MKSLKDWIRRVFTKTGWVHRGKFKKLVRVDEAPSERLVLFLQLSIVTLICLTLIEALHILVLRSFNWEVFSVITSLIGTITGVFVSQRA